MAEYRLSSLAVIDVTEIANYTIAKFGIEQARRYRDELENCFQQLVENPGLGRGAGEIAPGLRRHTHRSHIIFYTPGNKGILIVRILHQSMDIPRYL